MKALGVVLVAGAAVAGGAAIVYAVKQHEDDKKLPGGLPPPGDCATAKDVWSGTTAVLNNANATAQNVRDAADILRNWESNGQKYCDDNAKVAAQAAITVLDARAEALDKGAPPVAPPPNFQMPQGLPQLNQLGVPPVPFEVPGGHYYAGFGWCPPGAILNMKTGLCEFPEVKTNGGACCASCAHGEQCESTCGGHA